MGELVDPIRLQYCTLENFVSLEASDILSGSNDSQWLWDNCKDSTDRLSLVINGESRQRAIGENSACVGEYNFVTSEDGLIRLHYFEKGQENKGKGTLLLIHGFGSNAYQWSQVFDELAEDYHVIAIDLPGNGYADILPGHNYDFHDVLSPILNDFMDQKALTHVTLVGSSMGGGVAQSLALNDTQGRIEQLILFGSMGSTGKRRMVPPFVQAATLGPFMPEGAADEEMATWLTLTNYVHPTLTTLNDHDVIQFSKPYQPQREDETFCGFFALEQSGLSLVTDQFRERIAARAAYAEVVSELIGGDVQEQRVDDQRSIDQKTLIIHSEDKAIPVEVAHALDATIPESQLLYIDPSEVPTAGHTLMSDNPKLAIKIIRDFLEGDSDLTLPTSGETFLTYRLNTNASEYEEGFYELTPYTEK